VSDADAASRNVGVVVVAAGSGARLGAARPKAFVELAGRTLLERSVTVALAAGTTSLVVVVPEDLVAETTTMVDRLAECGGTSTHVTIGGTERTDSVRAGLAALDPECDIVLVHDAARCLTPVAVFERVVGAVAAGWAGAVPGVAVVDTVKTVDARGVITGTPDRARLRSTQTPQGFAAQVLRTAYASDAQATDDAALVEECGHDVLVVDGDPLAFKITTLEDLERAEHLLSEGGR